MIQFLQQDTAMLNPVLPQCDLSWAWVQISQSQLLLVFYCLWKFDSRCNVKQIVSLFRLSRRRKSEIGGVFLNHFFLYDYLDVQVEWCGFGGCLVGWFAGLSAIYYLLSLIPGRICLKGSYSFFAVLGIQVCPLVTESWSCFKISSLFVALAIAAIPMWSIGVVCRV